MKKLRKILERITEAVFTVCGAVTSIAILLIIVFLFREGFGLFKSPAVEGGYGLYVNGDNPVSTLTPKQIKDMRVFKNRYIFLQNIFYLSLNELSQKIKHAY